MARQEKRTSRKGFHLGRSSVLALLTGLLPFGAFAQTDVGPAAAAAAPTSDAPELRRELAGHNFIPSRFSLDPFVSTYVASETGFGYGSAPGRSFDLCGTVICPGPGQSESFSVGAFAQLLDYQYGFLDWWAVRVGTKILVYSGLNSAGVVGVGTNANANFDASTTLSFKVGNSLRLGGTLQFSIGPAIFLNIVQGILDSIKTGTIVTPVNSFSQWSIQPAFVGAWAINKALGMTFSADYRYTNGESDVTGTATSLLEGDVLFDFDMNALNWVPIGLLGGFATSFGIGETRFLQYRWQFGIMYTAVKPLNVGLEMVYNRAPVVGNTNIFLSSLIGLIVIQYNFN